MALKNSIDNTVKKQPLFVLLIEVVVLIFFILALAINGCDSYLKTLSSRLQGSDEPSPATESQDINTLNEE